MFYTIMNMLLGLFYISIFVLGTEKFLSTQEDTFTKNSAKIFMGVFLAHYSYLLIHILLENI